MRIAACPATQLFPLALVGLLERQSGALGEPCEFSSCNLQQAAVSRVGNCFLLDRRIDNHALELGRPYGFHLHGRRNCCREHLLDAGFAQRLPKAHEVGRIAWQARLEIVLAAEVLEVHVLCPALANRLITFVVCVLQVEQSDHQPGRQARTSGSAMARARQLGRRAEQINLCAQPAFASTPLEDRCQRRFYRRPGHSVSQYGQRVPQIDHCIQAAAEEIRCAHRRFSLPEHRPIPYWNWEFRNPLFAPITTQRLASRHSARPTIEP